MNIIQFLRKFCKLKVLQIMFIVAKTATTISLWHKNNDLITLGNLKKMIADEKVDTEEFIKLISEILRDATKK